MFRRLDDRVSVAAQLHAADLSEAAASGFVCIINNRPDGEAPDQPDGATMEAEARVLGLDYAAIPIGQTGFDDAQIDAQIDAMAELLGRADGPVLAYCRSGTRSTLLWSLARAKLGDAPATLHARANGAGYDLAPVAAQIERLSAGC